MLSYDNPVFLIATITLPTPLAGLIAYHKPKALLLLTGEPFIPSVSLELEKLQLPADSFAIIFINGQSGKSHPYFTDASACFDTAYDAAKQAVAEAKRSGDRVVCDFSEGTFLMRLGLLRAAEALDLPAIYRAVADSSSLEVAREEIDLQRERPFLLQSMLLAVERLTSSQRFDAAQYALELALSREASSIDLTERAFLHQLSAFVEGLIMWDRFDYRGAVHMAKLAHDRLAGMGDNPAAKAVIDAANSLLKWLAQVGSGVSSEFLAYDFLASAVRCSERGAYSDAIIRLYRALEAYGQYEACSYFNVQSTESFPTELIPDDTRFFSGNPFYKHGRKMDLGMEATFAVLRAAGAKAGQRFASFYERPNNEGLSLRKLQSMRNNCALAHGSAVIGESDFHRALRLMNSFLEVGKRAAWEVAPVIRIRLA